MSDYIKRENAIAVINNYVGDDSPYAQWLVRKIGQIDAVALVRCKDCKWWDECDELDENGYCHHGERKDDE